VCLQSLCRLFGSCQQWSPHPYRNRPLHDSVWGWFPTNNLVLRQLTGRSRSRKSMFILELVCISFGYLHSSLHNSSYLAQLSISHIFLLCRIPLFQFLHLLFRAAGSGVFQREADDA